MQVDENQFRPIQAVRSFNFLQRKPFLFVCQLLIQQSDTFSRNTNTNEEPQRRIENQVCFKCGKPGHFAKDCESQGSPTPRPQSEPSKSQSAANQAVRQGRWRKKTRFQTATTRDSQSDDSQDEEFTDPGTDNSNSSKN
jgi:hypothetical protein